MKKNVVVTILVVVGLTFVGINAHARGCCGSGGGFGAQPGWGTDPATDPVYKQFQEDTADIRKEIVVDRAELDALMAGGNPDPEKVRELSTNIANNQQKLAQIARENGLGPGAGGCGSCAGYGRGDNRGCDGGPNCYGGGTRSRYGSCGGCGGPGGGGTR